MSNVENKEVVLEDLTLEETFDLLEKKLKLLESGDISLEDSSVPESSGVCIGLVSIWTWVTLLLEPPKLS